VSNSAVQVEGDTITLTDEKLGLADLVALTSALRAPHQGAVLLRSAGPDFCLGRRQGAGGPPPSDPAEFRKVAVDPILDLYHAVGASPVPVIAAVTGRAVGLGFALAAACDMIIAAEDATFALPEIKSGFAPQLALTQVASVLPPPLAFHLAVTGEPIGAAALHAAGAVPVVAPAALVETVARDYVATLTGPAAGVKSFLRQRSAGLRDGDREFAAGQLSRALAARAGR
jgi:enoyl-CoA hydratase